MSIDLDLEKIGQQEAQLRKPDWSLADAWQLGTRLRELALANNQAVSIEIRLARETVFFCAMPGTAPANADWARRKRNVVDLFQRSSYAIGLNDQRNGSNVLEKMQLPARDYACHGGSFPLLLLSGTCVGSVTVSGLPQRADHALVVRALAEFCQCPLDSLALPDAA